MMSTGYHMYSAYDHACDAVHKLQFANPPGNLVLEMVCEVSVIEVDGEIVTWVFPPAVVQVSLVHKSHPICCIAACAKCQEC